MADHTLSSRAMLTEFFSSDHLEAAARRTGFVHRTSQITGKLFLAVVTFGVWSDAQTTVAQLAAKGAQLGVQGEGSPEASQPRMNKGARAFLREMIRPALEKIPSCPTGCKAHLFAYFTKGHSADGPGCGLPESLQHAFPGAGGSAAQAGAKIQLGWDDKRGTVDPCALTPGHMPDNTDVDTVVARARKEALCIWELGYVKRPALASIAAAKAYFLSRRNHQTSLFAARVGRLSPVALLRVLKTAQSHLSEKPLFLGATERVAVRLGAARLPEAGVTERRRSARKNAKKKGYTPAQAHLALLAWNLFITNVPCAVWATETVLKVYPIRWPIELIFKAWKSYLHLAAIPTKTADTTCCDLYGRLLLLLLNYALCPELRATWWLKKKRELRVLKLVRPFQALADRWLQGLFQAELALRRFLHQACATAERLVAKAARKRRTTAQILRESLSQQHAAVAFTAAVAA